MAPGRPAVVTGLALEGARDHPADGVGALQLAACHAARRVQLVDRDDVLVRGDLEHAVGRRVDDPAAGPAMLVAELLDDLRAGGGHVAEHPAAGRRREGVDHVVGKPVRERRKWALQDDPRSSPSAPSWCPCRRCARPGGPTRTARPAAAGSPRAAGRCPAPVIAGSAPRARRPPRRRGPGCSSRRCRMRRRPAGRRRRPRRARSRTPGACGKPTGRVRACGRTAARRRAGRPPGCAPARSWPAAEPAGR